MPFLALRKSYPEIVPRSTKNGQSVLLNTTKSERQSDKPNAWVPTRINGLPLCVIGRDFRTVQDCGQAGKKKLEALEPGPRQCQAGRVGAGTKGTSQRSGGTSGTEQSEIPFIPAIRHLADCLFRRNGGLSFVENNASGPEGRIEPTGFV